MLEKKQPRTTNTKTQSNVAGRKESSMEGRQAGRMDRRIDGWMNPTFPLDSPVEACPNLCVRSSVSFCSCVLPKPKAKQNNSNSPLSV